MAMFSWTTADPISQTSGSRLFQKPLTQSHYDKDSLPRDAIILIIIMGQPLYHLQQFRVHSSYNWLKQSCQLWSLARWTICGLYNN